MSDASRDYMPQSPEPMLPPGTVLYVLGPATSFSYQAALRVLEVSPGCTIELVASVDDLFIQLEQGQHVLMPYYNSSEGGVIDHLKELPDIACQIKGKVRIEVHMCLGGLPGTRLEDVQTLVSHSVGLKQSSRLRRNIREVNGGKRVRQISVDSTPLGATYVAEQNDPTQAALASEEAIVAAGLEVIQRDVSNAHMRGKRNGTHFFVLGPAGKAIEIDPTLPNHALLIDLHDEPRAIDTVIHALTEAGANFRPPLSIPLGEGEEGEEAVLFVELRTDHPELLQTTVQNLRRSTAVRSLRVLGSWNGSSKKQQTNEVPGESIPGLTDIESAIIVWLLHPEVPGGPGFDLPTRPLYVRDNPVIHISTVDDLMKYLSGLKSSERELAIGHLISIARAAAGTISETNVDSEPRTY